MGTLEYCCVGYRESGKVWKKVNESKGPGFYIYRYEISVEIKIMIDT